MAAAVALAAVLGALAGCGDADSTASTSDDPAAAAKVLETPTSLFRRALVPRGDDGIIDVVDADGSGDAAGVEITTITTTGPTTSRRVRLEGFDGGLVRVGAWHTPDGLVLTGIDCPADVVAQIEGGASPEEDVACPGERVIVPIAAEATTARAVSARLGSEMRVVGVADDGTALLLDDVGGDPVLVRPDGTTVVLDSANNRAGADHAWNGGICAIDGKREALVTSSDVPAAGVFTTDDLAPAAGSTSYERFDLATGARIGTGTLPWPTVDVVCDGSTILASTHNNDVASIRLTDRAFPKATQGVLHGGGGSPVMLLPGSPSNGTTFRNPDDGTTWTWRSPTGDGTAFYVASGPLLAVGVGRAHLALTIQWLVAS
jgi:hypothetical protein